MRGPTAPRDPTSPRAVAAAALTWGESSSRASRRGPLAPRLQPGQEGFHGDFTDFHQFIPRFSPDIRVLIDQFQDDFVNIEIFQHNSTP